MSALREVLAALAPDLIDEVRSAMRLDLTAAHRGGNIEALCDVPRLVAEIEDLNVSRSSRIRVFGRASYAVPSALIVGNMKIWGRQRRGDTFEIIDRPRSQEWDQFAAEREVYARDATLPFRMHLYDTVAYVAIDFDDLRAGAFLTRDPGCSPTSTACSP